MPQSLIETSGLESKTFFDAAQSTAAQLSGARMQHFTERSFPQLFEDQVARNPTKTALTCENKSLTFAELNSRANQLARYLRARGVSSDSLVGICVDRSLEMAVAIIAILKAGGAYLPLDPEYPADRLAFMLEDARPALVVAKSNFTGRLTLKTDQLVLIDQDWAVISQNDGTNLIDVPSPDDLAYVIYTSGSTGKPKGVMITHGNLANYLCALNHELQIAAEDRYLHTASVAFSSSRRQLMLPLSQGATVVIATSSERKDPLALLEVVKHRGITLMDAVPSFWRNCTSILSGLSAEERQRLLDNQLRLILSASEPLLSDIPQTWIKEFGHPARHIHMFGQTETAGIVSLYRVPESLDSEVYVVPVGYPIANTEIYILDEARRPCALGEAGELYIGGAGVGRGYLNRSELTAEKFISDPFSAQPGARLYRTGDWARVTDAGRIEFAGRRDQQVKLRGFRIELGEVEAALTQHPAVRETVVVARDQANGEKRLIAYFVSDGDAPTVGALRDFLSERLPDFVIPSAFVHLEAIPLSANGKVNRMALPDLDGQRPELSNPYVAPRDDIEKRLVAVWCDVLQITRIGINDNFFELGGHSLLAAQVISRIRREVRVETSLRALFESPTVASLAQSLQNPNAEALLSLPAIESIERNGPTPLSFTQQQFWLLDQAGPNSSAYNVRTAVRIAGDLDAQKLQRALNAIVVRHEVLRTNIVLDQGTPMQVVSPLVPIVIEKSDLTKLPSVERDVELNRALTAEVEKPFDLSNDPLLRGLLLKLDVDEHVLLLVSHHIACDGWSVNVLLRDLVALYETAEGETSPALPQLPIQYADFACWQRNWLQGPILEKQLSYWRQQLGNVPTELDLPTDFPRPAMRSFCGDRRSISLPESLSSSIKSFSRDENATLFMTLLSAFQTLLYRYGGKEDIIIGSPVAGRTMLETENLIGAFVNTLVFRGDFAGNPTFREFLGIGREKVLSALSNQDLPFEKLVEELNPKRNLNRSPLFQVMFTLQNTQAPDLSVRGLTLTPLKVQNPASKFDLSLEVEEKAGRLSISFEYSTELFTAGTIERMLAHFQNLLTAIVTNPAQGVADLPLLSDAERHQLLGKWNETGADPPSGIGVHNLFEAQAEKTPDAIAVEFLTERLTYGELNRRANQLAHYLRKQGVGPEAQVGICVERSFDMLVALLGVLKAGGAYVPLDPKYPRERIAFMIEDAQLALVITQRRLVPDIPDDDARLVAIDKDWETIAKESTENPDVDVAAENLSLLLYTSGSTGNPKGVMIEHRSLAHYAAAAGVEYAIKPGDRVLQFASLSFDMSAEEIHTALTHGATLVLRTDNMISSARDFFRCCEDWKVSVLDLPTAYWHELTDALSNENLKLPASVRLVIMGGEKVLPERVMTWQKLVGKSVRLINTYGPTETTIVATMCDLSTQDDIETQNNLPIGRPMANTTVYILDGSMQPVPIGVPGELYIGGVGVTRGYLNRPDLTAERFIPNPFRVDNQAKLYKTGDVVRYRADGNIEFLGRADNQVKIRGFRVELEEVEQAVRSYAGVADCVVVLREDDDHDKRLIAYVVPDPASPPTIGELRKSLKAKLPTYMVPAAFALIETMPLMPSGKIDRRALPEPEIQPETDEIFSPPRTPIEELLSAAWCEVLKLERIGIYDNFFDLGGHSLLAAKVVSNVRNLINVEFGMVDVFQAPTIASLAELLTPRAVQEESEDDMATLLAELASLSDEEAQLQFDHEVQVGQVLTA